MILPNVGEALLMLVIVKLKTLFRLNLRLVCYYSDLTAALQAEKDHFQLLHEALEKKSNIEMQFATDAEIAAVSDEVNKLLDSVPLQVQKVWDRTRELNIRERDDYSIRRVFASGVRSCIVGL